MKENKFCVNFFLNENSCILEDGTMSECYNHVGNVWHLMLTMKLNFSLKSVAGGTPCGLVHSPGTDWMSKSQKRSVRWGWLEVGVSVDEQVCI